MPTVTYADLKQGDVLLIKGIRYIVAERPQSWVVLSENGNMTTLAACAFPASLYSGTFERVDTIPADVCQEMLDDISLQAVKAKRKIVTDAVRRALNGSYREADVPRTRSIQLR